MLRVLTRDFEPVAYRVWGPLLRQMDEILDSNSEQNFDARDTGRLGYPLSCEVDETDQHYVMTFDVPGIDKADLHIEVTSNRLTVSGERKAEGRRGSGRYGKFSRQFTLPEGVNAEEIVAEHKDGVLRLAIKKPAAAKTTKIAITDGTKESRSGGFFKNLIGEKKVHEKLEARGSCCPDDAAATSC